MHCDEARAYHSAQGARLKGGSFQLAPPNAQARARRRRQKCGAVTRPGGFGPLYFTACCGAFGWCARLWRTLRRSLEGGGGGGGGGPKQATPGGKLAQAPTPFLYIFLSFHRPP
eukprot:SAG31_NODE_7600_length_1643_cov_16.983808_1_plen_113_part_10